MKKRADYSKSSIKTTVKKEGNCVYQKITKRTGLRREKTYSWLTQKAQVWNNTSTPSSSDCSSDEFSNEMDIVSPMRVLPNTRSSNVTDVEEVSAMRCEMSVDRSEQRSKKTMLEKGYSANETTSLMATSETSCSHQEDSPSLIIPSTRTMTSFTFVSSLSDSEGTENPNKNDGFANDVQSLQCDIVNNGSALPCNNISKFEADLQFLTSLFSNESLCNCLFHEPNSASEHPIEALPQNNQLLKPNPNSNKRHIVGMFDHIVCYGRLEVGRQVDYERSMIRPVERIQNDTVDKPLRLIPMKVTLSRKCFGSSHWRKVEIV